jgi:hypothetical protein
LLFGAAGGGALDRRSCGRAARRGFGSATAPPPEGDWRADTLLGGVACRDWFDVSEQATLFEVLSKMRARDATIAFVAEDGARLSAKSVRGLITRQQIAASLVNAVETIW